MDFAEALEANELWGWPVEVLDRLLELRKLAWDGAISIEEWRERDSAHRVGMPDVDTKEVKEFQHDWLINGPLDVSEEDSSMLTGRLSTLAHPAPSDEDLWKQLERTHEAINDPEFDRELKEKFRTRKERVATWLTRPGSGIDSITGLPWSQIGRYRIVDVPDIGSVPQFVDSARQLAVSNAEAAERQRASLLVGTPEWHRVETSMANLNQRHLIWLPRLLLEAVADDEGLRPLLADVTHIWSDLRVQRLLLEETSRGWPAPFDRAPGSTISDT